MEWNKTNCLLALILAPFVLLQWLIDSRYEKKIEAGEEQSQQVGE